MTGFNLKELGFRPAVSGNRTARPDELVGERHRALRADRLQHRVGAAAARRAAHGRQHALLPAVRRRTAAAGPFAARRCAPAGPSSGASGRTRRAAGRRAWGRVAALACGAATRAPRLCAARGRAPIGRFRCTAAGLVRMRRACMLAVRGCAGMPAALGPALAGRRHAMPMPVRGRRLRRSSVSALAGRVGRRIGIAPRRRGAALLRGARAGGRRRGRLPGEAERRGAERAREVQSLWN